MKAPRRLGADLGVRQSWEVWCRRCGGQRWVHEATTDPHAPFTCRRCQAVLAGRNAADPLV